MCVIYTINKFKTSDTESDTESDSIFNLLKLINITQNYLLQV